MANIELPLCKGYFTNDYMDDTADDDFLDYVNIAIEKQADEYRQFFVSLCYNCYYKGESSFLQCCSGCQLVSYCSRICQKEDRSRHKPVCKEFPVVDGKNVLYTEGSWKKHIALLRQRAAQIPNASAIFRNPRVCNTCKKSRQDQLENCSCGCVSYCSKKCSYVDKQHRGECVSLLRIAEYRAAEVPSIYPPLAEVTQCKRFVPVTCWEDLIPVDYGSPKENSIFKSFHLGIHLAKERFSYPMSLLFALQALPQRHLSSTSSCLEDLTSLTVHILTSVPLFDTDGWEIFMHRLPKLKQLNAVFVIQGRPFSHSFNLLTFSSMESNRCGDCEDKDRVMMISVKKMLYHMYYSSNEYTEPDVVVVYGNEYEMSSTDEDSLHSAISYRNMTHSCDSVLVLMDATKDKVSKGVKAVEAVQPVDQLVPPRANYLRGPSTNRSEMDADLAIINEKAYFSCLRRK